MNTTQRRRLAVTIPAALVAGGVAGAGVGFHWYGPAVGVALAVLIGASVGLVVLRTVLAARRDDAATRTRPGPRADSPR